MKRLVVSLLAFIAVTGHSMVCQWQGFGGCACNFLGACDTQGKPKSDEKTLKGYAPSGLEIFSTDDSPQQNLAYLCEGNTVAILYDCNKRIPLYAATVMSGKQLDDGYSRPRDSFRKSNDHSLHVQYQQHDDDYSQSGTRSVCYRTQAGSLLRDMAWYESLISGYPQAITFEFVNCHEIVLEHPTIARKPDRPRSANSAKKSKVSQKTTKRSKLPDKRSKMVIKVPVHKGHLIAAAYGRGNPTRAAATFTYTNTVPQFGTFNMGQWRLFEDKLNQWGRDHCTASNHGNVNMYIIVGAIPSTFEIKRSANSRYFRSAEPRYFGSEGFSNYMDNVYRINVPSEMWTAACCTFQVFDTSGKWVADETRQTAFWRANNPGKDPCHKADIGELFGGLAINLFPDQSSCSDSKNYVPIY